MALLLIFSIFFLSFSSNSSNEAFPKKSISSTSSKMIGTWTHKNDILKIFKESDLLLIETYISRSGWKGNEFELVFKDAGYYVNGLHRITYLSNKDKILFKGSKWSRAD